MKPGFGWRRWRRHSPGACARELLWAGVLTYGLHTGPEEMAYGRWSR